MSKIEWTEKTWNPIVGCSIVSPGCTNCYAMKMAARIEAIDEDGYRRKVDEAVALADDLDHENRIRAEMNNARVPSHYAGTTKRVNGNAVWTGNVALAPDHILTEPLRRRKPTMYFVNSMGDLFHEGVPDDWIDRVFAVMALCSGASDAHQQPRGPQHTFQVLTKRSARMREYMASASSCIRVLDRMFDIADSMALAAAQAGHKQPWKARQQAVPFISDPDANWPLPNVWLGVSAERQAEADARIPDLLATPAAVRFVSAEPLLGPIDFNRLRGTPCLATPGSCCRGRTFVDSLRGIQACERAGAYAYPNKSGVPRGLDWIIAGGESGPGARPMHPDWVRSIRDQCQAAGADASGHPKRQQGGVPFFFKQWGEWGPTAAKPIRGQHTGGGIFFHADGRYGCQGDWWDGTAAALDKVGKRAAGRLLDGRTWDEMPAQRPGADAGGHPKREQQGADAEWASEAPKEGAA